MRCANVNALPQMGNVLFVAVVVQGVRKVNEECDEVSIIDLLPCSHE